MSNDSNTSIQDTTVDFPDSVLPYSRRIWVNLVFLIPSIICSLFVLYCVLSDKALRWALHNHIMIILLIGTLICEVTIFPWTIYYYRFHIVWQTKPIFCQIWIFIDYEYYMMQLCLFAWATMERHILIFHDPWLSTKKKRFFVHYLPIIGIIFYFNIYYALVVFFPFCEKFYDYTRIRCVHLCAYENNILYLWDTIVHQILPNLLIIIFSIALFVRVIWQKHRLNQPIQWRKYRKLTIQLISFSILYLFFSFPWSFLDLLYICGVSYDQIAVISVYTSFLGYYVILLFPFVCAGSLPELRMKMKKIFLFRRRNRTVGPLLLNMRVVAKTEAVPNNQNDH